MVSSFGPFFGSIFIASSKSFIYEDRYPAELIVGQHAEKSYERSGRHRPLIGTGLGPSHERKDLVVGRLDAGAPHLGMKTRSCDRA
jgi:hypothetical protein